MLLNGHLETIIPSVFHKAPEVNYQRQRLELKDGDFIDLDWLIKNNHDMLLIITHGLEGNSDRYYVEEQPNIFMIEDGIFWLGIVVLAAVRSIGCLNFTIMEIPMI